MTLEPLTSSFSSSLLLFFLFYFLCGPLINGTADAQISASSLGLTQTQLDCINALSFDLCTRQDTSLTCPPRFYLDQFMDAVYQKQLFIYLVDMYISQGNISAIWLLSQTISPDDPYTRYIDVTYGTSCSTDPSINEDFAFNTTEIQARIGRNWWILLMRQAEFCTQNQIFVQGMGCVCKEDKNCDETDTVQFATVMKAMIFIVLVAFIVGMYRIYVFTRHGQGLSTEYNSIMQAISKVVRMLQNIVHDEWRELVARKFDHTSISKTSAPPPAPPKSSPSSPPPVSAVSTRKRKAMNTSDPNTLSPAISRPLISTKASATTDTAAVAVPLYPLSSTSPSLPDISSVTALFGDK